MTEKSTQLSGGVLVNKPTGMTSHDVVAHVRRLLPRGIKVGHSGTLDPFATGLLIVLLGSATRLVEYLHHLPKTYRTTITLGGTSTTDDITGDIAPTTVATPPTLAHVEATLTQFRGSQTQLPPYYAAIKVAGKKLYEYAREGRDVARVARPIEIYELRLLAYEYPSLTLEVSCSTGTYIRSLGRDIGAALATDGYVSSLTRRQIGPWQLADAQTLSGLSATSLASQLLPPEALVAHLPHATLTEENVAKLQQGRAVDVAEKLPPATPLALTTIKHHLIGIGHYDETTALLHPDKILPDHLLFSV